MTKNHLTFFLSRGHAFVGLDCDSCAEGQPAHIKAGYYPESNLNECEYQCPEMDDPVNDNNDSFGSMLQKQNQLQCLMFKSQSPRVLNNPKVLVPKSALISILKPATNYNILNEDPAKAQYGRSYCDGEESGIHFIRHSGYSEKDFETLHSVSHPITNEDAGRVYDHIKLMAETCVKDNEFQPLGSNCIDFTRRVADQTDELHDKSLTELYNFNPVSSLVGMNGVSGTYMLARDAYRAMGGNPVAAYFAGWALCKTYKWATNKLSRCLGMPFDPNTISRKQRKKHVAKICKARALLKDAINKLIVPFNCLLELTNAHYGVAEKRAAYLQLRSMYYSVRHQMRVCEKQLEQVEQVSSDYASLTTNYCSNTYASKVLDNIDLVLSRATISNREIVRLCAIETTGNDELNENAIAMPPRRFR